MRLGYGLITCQRIPRDPRTWVDRYREALELSRITYPPRNQAAAPLGREPA